MKKIAFIITLVMVFSLPILAWADWDIRFFGINVNDFEDRHWAPVILGGVSSYVVHEMGHYAAGELTGMDAGFKWDSGPYVWADNYADKSDNAKRLYHGGGFLAQTLVGSILTAVPYTRHSDFAVGFTGFSMANATMYGITGGRPGMNKEYSDVRNLDELGWNGTGFALGNGALNGILLYINLNKSDK